jgi:hypothetical protein
VAEVNRGQVRALIEDATVDCYNEDEQLTGFFTKMEENLELPFETIVLGVPVTVLRVDLSVTGDIVFDGTGGSRSASSIMPAWTDSSQPR